MKNQAQWKPTKFVQTRRGWRMSRDRRESHHSSRFIGDIVIQVYERLVREHAQGRLLDLGCGKVPLYGIYKEYVADNTCVDWGHTTHKSDHLDLETDLNQPIPLPDAGFDTILVTDVLEHIATPDPLWAEMTRLLAAGGKIILGVPFLYGIHEEPHDYHRYTEYKLRMMCEQNGLEVVSLESYGGIPEVILDLVAKVLSFSGALSSVHRVLSNAMLRTPSGRKLSAKTARQFPVGYGLVARKPPE